MSATDIRGTVIGAARKSKDRLSRQVDRQAAALGATLSQAAHDLEQLSSHLRDNAVTGGAGQLAGQVARYVDRSATYLQRGNTDAFIGDLEAFTRERPWAVAASAAALGFAAARLVKSSSVPRSAASSDAVPVPAHASADGNAPADDESAKKAAFPPE